VDYKKAFESVPHSWILKCFEIYKISPEMKDFIKASMTKWKTTLTALNHNKGTISSREIKIKINSELSRKFPLTSSFLHSFSTFILSLE